MSNPPTTPRPETFEPVPFDTLPSDVQESYHPNTKAKIATIEESQRYYHSPKYRITFNDGHVETWEYVTDVLGCYWGVKPL